MLLSFVLCIHFNTKAIYSAIVYICIVCWLVASVSPLCRHHALIFPRSSAGRYLKVEKQIDPSRVIVLGGQNTFSNFASREVKTHAH